MQVHHETDRMAHPGGRMNNVRPHQATEIQLPGLVRTRRCAPASICEKHDGTAHYDGKKPAAVAPRAEVWMHNGKDTVLV